MHLLNVKGPFKMMGFQSVLKIGDFKPYEWSINEYSFNGIGISKRKPTYA